MICISFCTIFTLLIICVSFNVFRIWQIFYISLCIFLTLQFTFLCLSNFTNFLHFSPHLPDSRVQSICIFFSVFLTSLTICIFICVFLILYLIICISLSVILTLSWLSAFFLFLYFSTHSLVWNVLTPVRDKSLPHITTQKPASLFNTSLLYT